MGDGFLILYHGTLNWHQGLDLAVRAFAKIKDLVPDRVPYLWVMVPRRESFCSLIEQLQLQDRVLLHERIPLREIPFGA